MCDRIISPLKGVVRRFCNEGNDILSAADMREALKVRPVKGCTAAVCEIERTDQEIKVNRIPNFSTFHNFSYEGTGLRMWKAYDIGAGKLVLWSDLDVQVPGAITLKPATNQLQFWDVQPRCVKLQGKTNQSVKLDTETALFECNEAGCSHSFDNYSALQDHINFGNHDPISTNQESVYDKLRLEWVRKFSTYCSAEETGDSETRGKRRRNTLLDEDLAHLDQQNKGEDVQEVLSQIGLEHPITYDGYDICDLVKTEALSRFTVKELRVMCDHFELPRKSTDKKAALIKHVTDIVEECSCS